jgi:hypothetical protein
VTPVPAYRRGYVYCAAPAQPPESAPGVGGPLRRRVSAGAAENRRAGGRTGDILALSRFDRPWKRPLPQQQRPLTERPQRPQPQDQRRAGAKVRCQFLNQTQRRERSKAGSPRVPQPRDSLVPGGRAKSQARGRLVAAASCLSRSQPHTSTQTVSARSGACGVRWITRSRKRGPNCADTHARKGRCAAFPVALSRLKRISCGSGKPGKSVWCSAAKTHGTPQGSLARPNRRAARRRIDSTKKHHAWSEQADAADQLAFLQTHVPAAATN